MVVTPLEKTRPAVAAGSVGMFAGRRSQVRNADGMPLCEPGATTPRTDRAHLLSLRWQSGSLNVYDRRRFVDRQPNPRAHGELRPVRLPKGSATAPTSSWPCWHARRSIRATRQHLLCVKILADNAARAGADHRTRRDKIVRTRLINSGCGPPCKSRPAPERRPGLPPRPGWAGVHYEGGRSRRSDARRQQS